MTLIIRDDNGVSHYSEIMNAIVNKNCEVVEVTNGFVKMDLRRYAGCDAVLVVGNRNEMMTIAKENDDEVV